MNSTRNGTSDVTSCHDEATHCDCEHMVVSHKCRYESTVSTCHIAVPKHSCTLTEGGLERQMLVCWLDVIEMR